MRNPAWMQRLDAVLAVAAHRPFEWGAWDCWHFAAACALAVGGFDPTPAHKPYKTQKGAERVLKGLGCGSVADLADRKFERLAYPLTARRGDLALVHGPFGPSIGVVSMCGMRVHCVGELGLESQPIESIAAAWRVG
jgi:hypothetical protein